MNATSFEVKSQARLKIVIVVGALLFVAVAVGFAWMAYVTPFAIQQVIMLAAALIVAWIATVCMRLIRFFNYNLEVRESSVSIRSPNETHSYKWADLLLRDRTGVQVTELRDRNGKLLFAIDWYGENARDFVQTYYDRIDEES